MEYRVPISPLAHPALRALLRELRPDVIHVQNHFLIGRTLVRLARQLGIPVIATNHFLPDNFVVRLRLPERVKERIVDRSWRRVVRFLNQTDLITTPTPTAARIILERGVARKVIPISCGIDLSHFGPADARASTSVSERKTCLYVGRLEAEKHIDELIRALSLVRERVDARLVVAGVGTQRAALEALTECEGLADRVTFTGFVPDETLPELYRQCDVFCIASTAELQCLAAMEAMASGKPVIAANARALPELVHHGVNGYTFPPGDVAELAARLVDVLSDPTRAIQMGANSRTIIARHALDHTLERFEQCYQTVVARSHQRVAAARSRSDLQPEA
jgi:glycosyltransferase involved in cell wall biosynthesis